MMHAFSCDRGNFGIHFNSVSPEIFVPLIFVLFCGPPGPLISSLVVSGYSGPSGKEMVDLHEMARSPCIKTTCVEILLTFGRQATCAYVQQRSGSEPIIGKRVTSLPSKSTVSCSYVCAPHRSCLIGESVGPDCLRFFKFCSLQPVGFMFACFQKFTDSRGSPKSCLPTSSVSLRVTEALRTDEDVLGIRSTGFLILCVLLFRTSSLTNRLTSACLFVCTAVNSLLGPTNLAIFRGCSNERPAASSSLKADECT